MDAVSVREAGERYGASADNAAVRKAVVSALLPLKLDVDNGRPLPLGVVMARLRRAGRRVLRLAEERSPGGHGWHVWVWVSPPPRTAVEVVALQLLLGSDPLREAYYIARARAVDAGQVARYWRVFKRWNVFYREGAGNPGRVPVTR